MAKIYLIRHAESIANAQGIYQGQSYDTELSPLGKQQAQAVGKRFADIHLDTIYTIPLKRAYQTSVVIKKYQKTSVSFIVENQIMETNHGEWEGKSKHDIAAIWPCLYEKWLTNPLDVEFPHGENYRETIHRVVSWYQKFLDRLEKEVTVAIITHSNVIQILWAHIHNIGFERLWEMSAPQAASITLVESHSQPRIVFENDDTHLSGLESDLGQHAI
jgi:broad specificity phosphatase PhoE